MKAKGTNKRRAKVIGGTPKEPIIMIDNDSDGLAIIEGRTIADGQPVPPGMPLYMVSKGEHGEHFIETLVEGNDGQSYERPVGSKGPAKVATRSYREGYDTIFGNRKKKGTVLN